MDPANRQHTVGQETFYVPKGIVVVRGKEKSNEKTTPLELVEPTQATVAQAESDLKHNINNPEAQVRAQSEGLSQRKRTTSTKSRAVKAKTRRVKDILSK